MRKCPICGKEYKDYPALSRNDNCTLICPICGIKEALNAYGITKSECQEILTVVYKKNYNK